MARRLRDLTRAQQDFIEGYINGICSFVARGPRGESVRKTERQFEECKSMMYEDEEKLVEMADDWLQGIIKVMAPPPAIYDYYEWRQIKPAEPEEIVPLRGMRRVPPDERRRAGEW